MPQGALPFCFISSAIVLIRRFSLSAFCQKLASFYLVKLSAYLEIWKIIMGFAFEFVFEFFRRSPDFYSFFFVSKIERQLGQRIEAYTICHISLSCLSDPVRRLRESFDAIFLHHGFRMFSCSELTDVYFAMLFDIRLFDFLSAFFRGRIIRDPVFFEIVGFYFCFYAFGRKNVFGAVFLEIRLLSFFFDAFSLKMMGYAIFFQRIVLLTLLSKNRVFFFRMPVDAVRSQYFFYPAEMRMKKFCGVVVAVSFVIVYYRAFFPSREFFFHISPFDHTSIMSMC